MQSVTFECPEEDIAIIDARASSEGLRRSDLLRRAIRRLARSYEPKSRPNDSISSVSAEAPVLTSRRRAESAASEAA